ncbi:MAG: outer membrane protein assembly factor BamD [Gemmatimonadales bacterium]
MTRPLPLLFPLLAALGCARSHPTVATAVSPVALTATAGAVDSLWHRAEAEFRAGHWDKAATDFERLGLEFTPGDTRRSRATFYLAESYLAQKNHLQATRTFRKVSDETPNDPLAAEALLRAGDAFAELWRRPELDPTYGQTALATYQELLNRYPDDRAAPRAKVRIDQLQERFAFKTYRAALFYFRLKAYDSAILYLKNLAATYPKASVTPAALVKLVDAYRILAYKEDLAETCGYLRKYHPDAPRINEVCPQAPERPS